MIEVAFTESFIVTYRFSFRGPAMPIGLKVILGVQFVPGVIDEVESWISSGSLPQILAWTPFTKTIRCAIPAQTFTSLTEGFYYSGSAEIGNYPWDGHVFLRVLESDVIRITPLGTGFKELSVSYKKS